MSKRPDDCIDCGVPLPLYRSNRMLRCSECAKKRSSIMMKQYRENRSETECKRCGKLSKKLKSKDFCDTCYHFLTYIPTPLKRKVKKKKVVEKKVVEKKKTFCKWCGEETINRRKFCKDTDCKKESIAWNKELKERENAKKN